MFQYLEQRTYSTSLPVQHKIVFTVLLQRFLLQDMNSLLVGQRPSQITYKR